VLSWSYAGSAIRVSRANGKVAFFIEVPPRAFSTGGYSERFQREWVWKGNLFEQKRRPFPPDCCGRRAIESAAKTYPQRAAEFNAEQQRDLQGANMIVFSPEKSAADIIRSYPFLRGSLYGINTVRIAESRGH
jgi:hypothetical protein